MKNILLTLILLTLSTGSFSQKIKDGNSKTPDNIRGCLNIAKDINSIINNGQIRNGMVKIWHIEGEVDLFADVTETRSGGKTKRQTVGWRLFDENNQEVNGTKNTRPRRNKIQTIIYTNSTDPEGCFVVEEK